jgi:hypothetical protein
VIHLETQKRRLIRKKTISLNNVLMAKMDGTISNFPDIEKKKFYVLIDLVIRHSKYNEGMHAHLMTEILKGQQFLGKKYGDYIDALGMPYPKLPQNTRAVFNIYIL